AAVAFSLGDRQVVALVGPTGCGKTTLLRIVAGLDRDFDGGVALPAHGTLGMVFQEPRLLPWRTVEQNVRLAAPQATAAGLDTLFQTLGLRAHRNHYPGELSPRLSPAGGAGRPLLGSGPFRSCPTSRSCRSTTHLQHDCAKNSPSSSTAVPSPRCW